MPCMIGTEREGFYEGPSGSRFGRLLDFLNRLDSAGLHYALAHTRPDSIMVDVSVPGWRWRSSSWQTVPWPSSGTDLSQGWSLIRVSSTSLSPSSARGTQPCK